MCRAFYIYFFLANMKGGNVPPLCRISMHIYTNTTWLQWSVDLSMVTWHNNTHRRRRRRRLYSTVTSEAFRGKRNKQLFSGWHALLDRLSVLSPEVVRNCLRLQGFSWVLAKYTARLPKQRPYRTPVHPLSGLREGCEHGNKKKCCTALNDTTKWGGV